MKLPKTKNTKSLCEALKKKKKEISAEMSTCRRGVHKRRQPYCEYWAQDSNHYTHMLKKPQEQSVLKYKTYYYW